MSKTFDEYFRVFSNYTDKELIAMAQPERSDKMERSELHALVQVISASLAKYQRIKKQ